MKLSERELKILAEAERLLSEAAAEEIEIDFDIDLHHDAQADLEIELPDEEEEEEKLPEPEPFEKIETFQESKRLFRSWKRLSGI